MGMGIGAGDEVIVPAYSFITTDSAVLRVTAIPVFADIDLATCNIDPCDVERKITAHTEAIIRVHFGGLPCDMDRLHHLAAAQGIQILEDACHSWGSKWRGKGTGAIGDCGAFSFQMSKNITAGEGGIVLSDNAELVDSIRSYTNTGRREDTPWYVHHILGMNLRMTEFQAALLLAQLTRIEQQTLQRMENATCLDRKLESLPGIRVQKADSRATRRSYHLYVFRIVTDEAGLARDIFVEALQAEGIPCGCGYPYPLYRNPLFLDPEGGRSGPEACPFSCPYQGGQIDYSRITCSNTEQLCQEAVWIPHTVLLADSSAMDDIVRACDKVLSNRSELRLPS